MKKFAGTTQDAVRLILQKRLHQECWDERALHTALSNLIGAKPKSTVQNGMCWSVVLCVLVCVYVFFSVLCCLLFRSLALLCRKEAVHVGLCHIGSRIQDTRTESIDGDGHGVSTRLSLQPGSVVLERTDCCSLSPASATSVVRANFRTVQGIVIR